MRYKAKLERTVNDTESCLCVGLDPHLHLFPVHFSDQFPDINERVLKFLTKVIEITHPYCAAYKPNLAFFEALGKEGLKIFQQVIDCIPEQKIIIADAKRGDIGSTAENYKKAFFDNWDVDAITLNPLMGFETLSSYFPYPNKAIYTLALTSNPGAADFLAKPFAGFDTMAEYIAASLQKVQPQSEAKLGMVTGATHPSDLSSILNKNPTSPLLIPGIGEQGGKIKDLVQILENHEGIPLISSSRSILFAGGNSRQWEKAVEKKAREYQTNLMPITKNYV